jgi:uncharacterized membrane protein
MKSRAAYWLEILRSSFWLLPTMISLLILALAVMVGVLEAWSPQLAALPFLGGATVEGTRLLLSSIATAVMTVVGVLFSVTILVLQQVSQQYSPRVIDNFIRSRANQTVLGFYVGTFGYSLILLRTIHDGEQNPSGPPQLGPLIAILLALTCLALLIYFIHLLARSIKSNMILAAIRQEATKTLADLQSDLEMNHHAGEAPPEWHRCEFLLRAARDGYLQEVSWWQLARILKGEPWQGETLVIPGDYIHKEMPLLRVRTGTRLMEKQRRRIEKIFVIDLVRTHSQDGRFGVRQMVDIALKALSPGVNDPSTAVEAVNEIGTVLLYYSNNCIRSRDVSYPDGSRLMLKEPSYGEFVDLCVNEIALAGRGFFLVEHAILKIINLALEGLADPERREVLETKRREIIKLAAKAPGAELFRNADASTPA